jgi:uncharacterized protein YifE (UPF0438 family)
MANWHYRPCKIVHEDGSESWDVRSFYYDDEGTPRGWSQHCSYPYGDTLEQLKNDLQKMMEDVATRNVLTLYIYTCTECGESDARTEKERTICPMCLSKEKSE